MIVNKKPWPENFNDIVKESFSVVEVLRKCNVNPIGYEYKRFYKECQDKNIDFSHFIKNKPPKITKYTNEEMFVQDSPVRYAVVKNRIIKDKLLPENCAICGIKPLWNNKKLVMIMDHINGNNKDNRIENLRMICPNCNSQTDTFAGRNVGRYVDKIDKKCKECDQQLYKSNNSGLCRGCASLKGKRRKLNWPDKQTLIHLWNTTSRRELSRQLDINVETIRRKVKSFQE